MEYTEVKQSVLRSPELAGLDNDSKAFLLWRAEELQLDAGALVYVEGAKLDDTFCLMIAGELLVEQSGNVLGEIPLYQIFGEVAYFTQQRSRTATIRAGTSGASLLKIGLTSTELGSGRFESLKQYLGRQAWGRFVSDSQRNV